MSKEEQKKLLTEVMDADAKDGLYEPTVSKMETTQQKDHIGDTNKMVTAVEWLVEQLRQLAFNQKTHLGMGDVRVTQGLLDELHEQAKAMEKEQIINAYDKGYCDGGEKLTWGYMENYYSKTYGK